MMQGTQQIIYLFKKIIQGSHSACAVFKWPGPSLDIYVQNAKISKNRPSKMIKNICIYYTMNFMQGQGLAKSRSHAHV